MDSKQEFLRRMFIFHLQHVFASFLSIASFVCIFKFWESFVNDFGMLAFLPIYAFYNTITYLWTLQMTKKYGVSMFADLDQEWLREHQAFDAKAFGEFFTRLTQCRKISGPYLLAVMFPIAVLHMGVAILVGVIYIITSLIYRHIYFGVAISYKVPRAFGGGGLLISKIIDQNFEKFVNRQEKNNNRGSNE